MVGLDAGVEDGDGDALALGGLPGLLGVHGVEGPLLGTYAVGVRDAGRDEGERGGEEDAHRSGTVPGSVAALRSDTALHEGFSVGEVTSLRRARSMRSARPWASLPRPAWAGAEVAPDWVACSAESGVSTLRPSAQPETA